MAAPGGKGSSRWGSFLQQAVAGVESRLDTILAESDEAQPAAGAATTTTNSAAGAKASSAGKLLTRLGEERQEGGCWKQQEVARGRGEGGKRHKGAEG